MAPNRNGKTPYKHKQNRGSMFDNDRKTTEKHPDFTGSIDIEGVVYWISGWTGMTNDNRKRKISLSVQRQEERATHQRHDDDDGYGGPVQPRGNQRQQPSARPTRW